MATDTRVTVGGEEVILHKPASYSLGYDIFAAGVLNRPRALAAALGLCWKGKEAPKASYELTYSPMVYGGQVLDELMVRGFKSAEVLAAGVLAYNLLTADLFGNDEVDVAEGKCEAASECSIT